MRADSRTPIASGLPPWLRVDGDGVLISVHLQPAAKRTRACGEHGGRLKVSVQAPPVEGRANDALLAWLAETLGLPRQQVSIRAGLHGRDKLVTVAGIDADAAAEKLRAT